MAPLTIRNLTPHELKLTATATHPILQASSSFSSAFGNLTSLISTPTTSPIRASPTATTTDSHTVGLSPFQTTSTEIPAPEAAQHVLKATLEKDGHQYTADLPSPDNKAAVLTTSDGAPLVLTSVYLPSQNLLTLLSHPSLNTWMGHIPNDTRLSRLSIPGTHNSPCHYSALPSVRCQSVSITEQLQNGIRFFDIRVSVSRSNPQLALVHSVFPISLSGTKYLDEVLPPIYDFLNQNPSETVLLSIKREGTGKGTDQHLSEHLQSHYIPQNKEKWHLSPDLPTLGAARGKIILISRYGTPENHRDTSGLLAAPWPDNCTDCCTQSLLLRIQDMYTVPTISAIADKEKHSIAHLERACTASSEGDGNGQPLFINFLTASNFFKTGCWPEKVAARVNPAVVEYLCGKHGEGKGDKGGATGVVVMDWVGEGGDWDLVRCVVGQNSRLMR